jgi:hypothetical protein
MPIGGQNNNKSNVISPARHITTKHTAPGFTNAENYNASAGGDEKGLGGKTLLEIPSDIIYAWNWKESVPNAVISQLTTFVCLWAVEIDFGGYTGEKNPRTVNYWKDLLNSGYELSSQVESEIDVADKDGKIIKMPPRIMPVNRDYVCKIDGTPVKYIPALPNIAQVLTKDAKGGVGLDRVSLEDPGGGNFSVTLSLRIQNPYELMEESSFWRFFVPGQAFLLTTGWQDDGSGYYNPNRGVSFDKSSVLFERFKDWPSKKMVPPIIDPATGMLNKFFFDIKTYTDNYFWPAYGFWQSLLLVLVDPSFTLQGSELSGNLTFQTYGFYTAKKVLTGEMTSGITKFINNGDISPAIVSEKKSDFNIETGSYKKDSITQQQIHYIKLTDALKSLCASYNTAILKNEESQIAYYNKLIFYSDDDNVNPGDIIDAVVVPGTQTKQGPCNFYLGIPSNANVTPVIGEKNTEDTKVNNNTVANEQEVTKAYAFNKVLEKLYMNEDFKKLSIYWQEDMQKNIQQADSKNKTTLSDVVYKMGDLPINYQSFIKWIDERKKFKADEILEDFVNIFLYNELRGVFQLLKLNNFHVLVFSDQYYKLAFDDQKNKNRLMSALPALQFREHILNEFRWRYFTLRYGDIQSLIMDVSINRGMESQMNPYTYRTLMGLSKNLANSSTSIPGKGGAQNSEYQQGVVEPQTNLKNSVNMPSGEGTLVPFATGAGNTFNDIDTSEASADGGSNASNSGSAARNDTLRQFLQAGLEEPENGGPAGAIGTYLKYYYNKINVTIHGTFGLYPTGTIYFVGLFEWLRGFFKIMNVQHEIGPDFFSTKMEINWLGPDHRGSELPSLVYRDKWGNIVNSTGVIKVSDEDMQNAPEQSTTAPVTEDTKTVTGVRNQ